MEMAKQDPVKKQQWEKEHLLLIGVKFHRKNDTDILEYLSANETKERTKQNIMKDALREYMKNHPGGNE